MSHHIRRQVMFPLLMLPTLITKSCDYSKCLHHKGISFCNCQSACVLSCQVVSVSLWPPWTIACQAPLSIEENSRQEYWSGLLFPPPGDLPDPAIKPASLVTPALAGRILTTEPPRKPYGVYLNLNLCTHSPNEVYKSIRAIETMRTLCFSRTRQNTNFRLSAHNLPILRNLWQVFIEWMDVGKTGIWKDAVEGR